MEQVFSAILEVGKSIADVQISANQETKSSAGDKYETGRAMAQLEIQKLTPQLAEKENMLRILKMIDSGKVYKQVELGCLVQTEMACYFISVPLGKVALEGIEWFCISPASPIGLRLMGLKNLAHFEWNGLQTQIRIC